MSNGVVAVDGQNSRVEEQWLSVEGKLIVQVKFTAAFFDCSDVYPFKDNRIGKRMEGL